MFNCNQCPSVFARKDNLTRHVKTHAGERFPCIVCGKLFTYKSNLNKHLRNVHDIVNMPVQIVDQPARQSVIQFAPGIARPAQQNVIQIALQIFVPDIPASSSNMMSDDDICMFIMDEYENQDLGDTDSYTTMEVNGKRVSTTNTTSAVREKKTRMNMVKSPGFVEISSFANRTIVWYYAKNIDNVQNYSEFLHSLEPELTALLKSCVHNHPIKFNLKLKASYSRPYVSNSVQNKAFKTSAIEVFEDTDIAELVERAYTKLMGKEDTYTSRGSGFTLESIDGLLLAVYKYIPMSGSSYIELPLYIDRKRGTINPQNVDQQCFKWAILAKHVTEQPRYRIGENYTKHEGKYNFDGISFPTLIFDILKFEKNNLSLSINVYGIEKKFQPPRKFPTYEVYPLRVVNDEKPDHIDLLWVTDDENTHFIYISNFSRLIRAQKTAHEERVIFCKRCFTSFDNRLCYVILQ